MPVENTSFRIWGSKWNEHHSCGMWIIFVWRACSAVTRYRLLWPLKSLLLYVITLYIESQGHYNTPVAHNISMMKYALLLLFAVFHSTQGVCILNSCSKWWGKAKTNVSVTINCRILVLIWYFSPPSLELVLFCLMKIAVILEIQILSFQKEDQVEKVLLYWIYEVFLR